MGKHKYIIVILIISIISTLIAYIGSTENLVTTNSSIQEIGKFILGMIASIVAFTILIIQVMNGVSIIANIFKIDIPAPYDDKYIRDATKLVKVIRVILMIVSLVIIIMSLLESVMNIITGNLV